jgi:hypothetical protein
LLQAGLFSTHVWKMGRKVKQSTFHTIVTIGSPPLCTIVGADMKREIKAEQFQVFEEEN